MKNIALLIIGILFGFIFFKTILNNYENFENNPIEPNILNPTDKLFKDDNGICYRYHLVKIS